MGEREVPGTAVKASGRDPGGKKKKRRKGCVGVWGGGEQAGGRNLETSAGPVLKREEGRMLKETEGTRPTSVQLGGENTRRNVHKKA